MSAAKNSVHPLVLRLIAERRRDAQAKRDDALRRKAYGDASAWDHEDIGLMLAERIVVECSQNMAICVKTDNEP